jgi:ABC-type antimicrobial peptide transport system permease subunit
MIYNTGYRDAGGYDVISSLYINKEKSYFYNFTSNNVSYPKYKEEEDGKFNFYTVTLNGTDLYMIISEGMRKEYAVSPDTRSFLQINGNPPYGYSVRIASMQIKIAGVPQFSSYSSISRFAPGLISLEQVCFILIKMNQIIQRAFQRNPSLKDRYLNSKYKNKIYDLARKRFLFSKHIIYIVKFNQNTTRPIKDIVFMELQNLIDSDNTQVVMTDDLLKAAEEASDVLNLFFIIIGLIALILSFFLIWMSFYSNIRENICEYGILRAIGLSKAQSLRVYLYEATVLIFSSIIIGTFIGIVVSTTLVLQFDLFSEFPFRIFVDIY